MFISYDSHNSTTKIYTSVEEILCVKIGCFRATAVKVKIIFFKQRSLITGCIDTLQAVKKKLHGAILLASK